MNQQDFEARFGERWDAFSAWLDAPPRSPRKPGAGLDPREIPVRYREICQHLALAQDRMYGAELVERLSRLALAGHQRLYGAHGGLRDPVRRFVVHGFPAAVRAQIAYVLLAALLFLGPLVTLGAALQAYPDFAYVVLPMEQIDAFEEMYGKDVETLGRKRDAADDAVMFAYYIWNNVRIGFQTFASGITFGLGTVFFLLYNGVTIGTVLGYLVHAGLAGNFFSFTSGHSAFELGAIVLCGAAGLRIAHALIAPGRLRRGESLRRGAREAMPVVIGAAAMLVLAAAIEGFWSPRTQLPHALKYGAGIVLWLLTLAYFAFMGRGAEREGRERRRAA